MWAAVHYLCTKQGGWNTAITALQKTWCEVLIKAFPSCCLEGFILCFKLLAFLLCWKLAEVLLSDNASASLGELNIPWVFGTHCWVPTALCSWVIRKADDTLPSGRPGVSGQGADSSSAPDACLCASLCPPRDPRSATRCVSLLAMGLFLDGKEEASLWCRWL